MEPGHYASPVEEALSHGSQRVAQFASLTGAMMQVVLQRKALSGAREAAGKDDHAVRILGGQERLLHDQARLRWAPAHDRHWLGNADLLQTGQAWAAAAGSADNDPTAATAIRKCEDRLRGLHPYAMTRYDQLRADGLGPLDAMHQAAPFFAYPPGTRTGDPAPGRPALAATSASTWPDLGQTAEHTPGDAAEPGNGPDSCQQAELRGRQIITRLRSGARVTGRPEPGADELAMILEATTNLPADLIDRLTRQAAAEARARAAGHLAPATGRGGTADPDRSAAQLAALSFPASAADAVQAAPTAQIRSPARSPDVIHRQPGAAVRPGQSL